MNSAELEILDITAPLGRVKYMAARLKYTHQYRKSAAELKAKMVAFPEPKRRLAKELKQSKRLGATPDGKHIYLFDYSLNSSVIRELGRLRELSFRSVGEGTHKLRDIDKYDKTYRHIVLWDDTEQEIVGAYRIGEAFRLIKNDGAHALYTNELFEFKSQFDDIFPFAIELGRSFIQPKYWTKRGLDYLWQGIGGYLKTHPQVRYLFGAVSISNDYPELAKQQIAGFYQHFYQPCNANNMATARMPYRLNRSVIENYRSLSVAQASRQLKRALNQQGVVLPTLYKHYSELCEPQGVNFVGFNVDPDFSFCVDGLILVDLNHIKENKKRRYLTPDSTA